MSPIADPTDPAAGRAGDVADGLADDPVFRLHAGGKLDVTNRVELRTREDLARVYTPGFTRVARAIADDPAQAYRWSIKGNTVAIVTDGTAVSGLGDLGPTAALPVMEGKALLFKEFAGINAFPICLATKDVDEIVQVVKSIEPTFGGVMLEDISAPRCFAIEDRLRAELSIPVLHDDQHATAVAAAAALINAAAYVNKKLGDLKVVIAGAGAAGTSAARLFMQLGVQNVVACDRQGALHRGRRGLSDAKLWFAEHTNPGGELGSIRDVLAGADVFVGLAGPGVLAPDDLLTMAKDPVVFALSNPVPEFLPDEVKDLVAVIATGRSDFANQIDCGLCYPGIFRGALDTGATQFNEEMKLAAARAIAGMVDEESLSRGRVVPDIFEGVAARVAEAVAAAALESGAARVRHEAGTDTPRSSR
jgi:malate dehydrogenase (oxaloacetate-decarboxylating)